MLNLKLIASFVTGMTLFGMIASADIVQSSFNSGAGMNAYFGQSFTATSNEPVVAVVSFRWAAGSPSAPDPDLTATIFDGAGFGGSILGTSNTLIVDDNYPDDEWVDFTFSPYVPLSAGNMYSMQFSYTGSGPRTGGYYTFNLLGNDSVSPYVGGLRLDASGNPIGAPTVTSDLMFRVLAPEPGSLSLLAVSAVVALRRRTTI